MLFPLLVLGLLLPLSASGQLPTHPIITEAFLDPEGNDGPIGTAPNVHQEFIELYLPTASALEPGLSKDALNLTLYEVEGDFESTHVGEMNWRIDLPTFDLDTSNGITPGAVARPSSGLVVLGWLEYLGDPPVDLAGTPSTRVPLVNLGNPAVDFTFIGINGNQFGGTTNFPTPVAVSYLELVTHPYTGLFENGSGVLLLMDRDHVSYVELCSVVDPGPCDTDADLANGLELPPPPLLDAFAPNDHNLFDPGAQPYLPPTGNSIDLEFELRLGGVYSTLAPQLEELAEGYARNFLDVQKTTEDAILFNEDPADDSERYRQVDALGPFVPTPGAAAQTTDPASLSVLVTSLEVHDMLVGTTAHPSPAAANLGGDFGMSFLTIPFESPDAPGISVLGADSSSNPVGQAFVYPEVRVVVSPSAQPGESAQVHTVVFATSGNPGDPPLAEDLGFGITTVRVVEPTTGQDALGDPFQATSLFAVQGLEDAPGVVNDFAASDLGQYLVATAGSLSADSDGKLATLLDPATDLSDPLVVDPLISELPNVAGNYIAEAGPPGRKSLVETVLTSAEVLAGGAAYAGSFNGSQTLLKARRFTINSADGMTGTSGSLYTPLEPVHYLNSSGRLEQGSGFWKVETDRDFELAIVDTNVKSDSLETGSKDDFGVIVKVGSVRAGSPVIPGEFVFLSMMGGREGADVDTLRIPPNDPTFMSVILIDLDPLDTVLDVETITDVYLVDANGSSRVNPLEVFSLNCLPEPSLGLALSSGVVLLGSLGRRRRASELRRLPGGGGQPRS